MLPTRHWWPDGRFNLRRRANSLRNFIWSTRDQMWPGPGVAWALLSPETQGSGGRWAHEASLSRPGPRGCYPKETKHLQCVRTSCENQPFPVRFERSLLRQKRCNQSRKKLNKNKIVRAQLDSPTLTQYEGWLRKPPLITQLEQLVCMANAQVP